MAGSGIEPTEPSKYHPGSFMRTYRLSRQAEPPTWNMGLAPLRLCDEDAERLQLAIEVALGPEAP